MENLSKIKLYLTSLIINQDTCKGCFIFGSLAKGVEKPNDCDLLWVTTALPDSSSWVELQSLIIEIKVKFKNKFGLPLNILLYTIGEFNENTDLKKRIFDRPTIEIKKLHTTSGCSYCGL